MKIVDFFLIVSGKLSELEPEPELEPDKNGPAPHTDKYNSGFIAKPFPNICLDCYEFHCNN
jgi:hypothetical protein